MRECTQRGRANPTRATAEGRQSGGGQDGRRWEGISPGKKSGPSQGTPEGRKHPFTPHPPRQWEEPPERPRGEDPPGKGRSKGGQNRQGKQQAQGQMTGGSDKGHTETLGGATGCLPPCLQPGLLGAVDIRQKGGDLGQDMLGDEPYSTMCSMAMAGKVAFVGGGPNCRTWSIPKPGGPPPVRGRAEQTLWGLEDLEPG